MSRVVSDPTHRRSFHAPAVLVKDHAAVVFDAVSPSRGTFAVDDSVTQQLEKLHAFCSFEFAPNVKLYVLGQRVSGKRFSVLSADSLDAVAVKAAAEVWRSTLLESVENAQITTTLVDPEFVVVDKDYWVYLITSSKGGHYVGSTNNVTRRIKQHNGELTGGAKKTKGRGPWVLAHKFGPFKSRNDARKAEYALENPGANDFEVPPDVLELYEKDPTEARAQLAKLLKLPGSDSSG